MKLFKVHKPVVIFAVNDADHAAAWLGQHNVPFKQVEGYYKGEYENSFVVGAKYAEYALQLAAAEGQDTMLYLDEYRKASLVQVDTGTQLEPFGQWQAAPPHEARKVDHTYDPLTGTWYVVR